MNTPIPKPQSPPPTVVDARTAQESLCSSSAFLLDVRGFDEFAAGHAEGAICIPLPGLERRAGDLPTNRPVLVMCQSGRRSAIAAERLRALGMDNILDGQSGFNAWRQAGLPAVKQSGVIPLERQVRIAAGTLVVGFSLVGFLVNTASFYGVALIGFMLVLTGTLGVCPMMSVLKMMPWNRISTSTAPTACSR